MHARSAEGDGRRIDGVETAAINQWSVKERIQWSVKERIQWSVKERIQ